MPPTRSLRAGRRFSGYRTQSKWLLEQTCTLALQLVRCTHVVFTLQPRRTERSSCSSRRLGKTGFQVSESFARHVASGAASGEADSMINWPNRSWRVLIDQGVNFIDTADVYEDRQSEAAVARVVKRHGASASMLPRNADGSSRRTSTRATRPMPCAVLSRTSLQNTGFETLDLIQLHCPPTEVYYRPEIFGLFEELQVRRKNTQPRRKRRKSRGSTQGDRVSQRHDRADHLQHVPPAPRRTIFRGGRSPRRRRHCPRSVGQRIADGPLHPRHAVRRGRPSAVQSRWQRL